MYRVVGVASKVTKLMTMGLDRRKADQINLEDNIEDEKKPKRKKKEMELPSWLRDNSGDEKSVAS